MNFLIPILSKYSEAVGWLVSGLGFHDDDDVSIELEFFFGWLVGRSFGDLVGYLGGEKYSNFVAQGTRARSC